MSETNKAIVRRFYDDVFSQGDLEAIDELVSDTCVEHTPVPGLPSDNVRGALRAFATMLHSGLPDVRVWAEEIVAEGNLVAVHWKAEGSHDHELMGLPATGRRVSFEGLDLVRVVDGKCTDHWGFDNAMLSIGGAAFPDKGGASSRSSRG